MTKKVARNWLHFVGASTVDRRSMPIVGFTAPLVFFAKAVLELLFLIYTKKQLKLSNDRMLSAVIVEVAHGSPIDRQCAVV